MKHAVIPIFIPHKGCPFDCIYCNQKTISGELDEVTIERMSDIIETHLASIGANTHIEIGFYGGSFTGIHREQQIGYLRAANKYIEDGRVEGIRLSTRPDYISREILEYLSLYKVRTIELGVQSLDQRVLDTTCRGHNRADVFAATALIKEYGIALGIQTMIGLPEDTREKDMATALEVVGLRPEIVRIYPTLVIKGTYLEKMYLNGKYEPLKLEDAVEISADLLEIYDQNGIKVIRIGLQPTDHINEGMDVVAGPFHPAFRQLVESRLYLKKVEEQIISNGLQSAPAIKILSAPRNVSNIIGQKKSNIEFLRQKYRFKYIDIVEDTSMESNVLVK